MFSIYNLVSIWIQYHPEDFDTQFESAASATTSRLLDLLSNNDDGCAPLPLQLDENLPIL